MSKNPKQFFIPTQTPKIAHYQGPKKSKMTPKLGIEKLSIENESCVSTLVDPKTVFKPYFDPKNSPLGPQKVKKKTPQSK